MRNNSAAVGMLLSVVLWMAAGICHASPAELARARAFIDLGRAQEAYEILAPLEARLAGDEEFDYLLGIASLDSGRPDKATLALERVLTVNPDFAGARLDFARAYFALGNTARAKLEFEIVLQQNPPEAARVTIENYLAAIEQRIPGKRVGLSGYIEANIGYDSNVNNSVDESEVYVPLFGVTFALSPTSVQISDAYMGVAFGGLASQQLSSAVSAYVAGDIKQRRNFDASEFNTLDAELRAAVSAEQAANSYSLGVQLARLYLDGETNRNLLGLTAEWRRTLNANNQLGIFGQYSQLRYPDPAIDENDVDQLLGGVGGVHVLGDGGRSVLYGSLYGGNERAISGRPDGDKRLLGMRLGTQLLTAHRNTFSASFGVQSGKFSEENLAFQVLREDTLYDLNLSYTWHIRPMWSLRPRLVYSRNDSTVPIYEYTRTDISLAVRRDFK